MNIITSQFAVTGYEELHQMDFKNDFIKNLVSLKIYNPEDTTR